MTSLFRYILDEIFSSLTSFGSPVFYILVILILLSFNVPFAFNLFLVLLFVEIFCVFIKVVYRKERPIPQLRKDLFSKIDANSFPSVHTARISLLVGTVILYYKNTLLSIIGIALILGVGYSRIYLKKHYLIDVLFGIIIGMVIALVFFNK